MGNESSKNIISPVVRRTEEKREEKNESIEIIDDGDYIKIAVNKKFLLSKSTFDRSNRT